MAKLKQRRSRKSESTLPLTNLPDVPLDMIISYLDPDSLRAFHQVSKSWNASLENRRRENNRRIELVEKIKLNKENLNRSRNEENNTPEPILVIRRSTRRIRGSDGDDKKSNDSSILMELCMNQLDNTPTITPNTTLNTTVSSTPGSNSSFLNNSHYEFQEEDSLDSLGWKPSQHGRLRKPKNERRSLLRRIARL